MPAQPDMRYSLVSWFDWVVQYMIPKSQMQKMTPRALQLVFQSTRHSLYIVSYLVGSAYPHVICTYIYMYVCITRPRLGRTISHLSVFAIVKEVRVRALVAQKFKSKRCTPDDERSASRVVAKCAYYYPNRLEQTEI